MIAIHRSSLTDTLPRIQQWVSQSLSWKEHLDTLLQGIQPHWGLDNSRARIVAREQLTPDSITLLIQPHRFWHYHFKAGQYLPVTVEIQGVRHTRCYSIACSPRQFQMTGLLEITVRREPGGLVSNWLNDHARPNTLLLIGEPDGNFSIDAAASQPTLFVAAGSGITPAMSMIRHLLDNGTEESIRLLYTAPSPEQLIYQGALISLADRHDNFHYTTFTTRSPGGDQHRRLDQKDLKNYLKGNTEVYLCGSGDFVSAIRQQLTDLGHPAQRVHFEQFSRLSLPQDAETPASHTGRIHLSRQDRDVPQHAGMTVLESLEQAGLKPRHGCRMGICQSCKCKGTGTIYDLQKQETVTLDNAWVKPCVSQAAGPLTLDL